MHCTVVMWQNIFNVQIFYNYHLRSMLASQVVSLGQEPTLLATSKPSEVGSIGVSSTNSGH
jgi:hypothetical protein